jgi:hypothetical protein
MFIAFMSLHILSSDEVHPYFNLWIEVVQRSNLSWIWIGLQIIKNLELRKVFYIYKAMGRILLQPWNWPTRLKPCLAQPPCFVSVETAAPLLTVPKRLTTAPPWPLSVRMPLHPTPPPSTWHAHPGHLLGHNWFLLDIKTESNEFGRRLDRASNSRWNLLKIIDSDGGWTRDGYLHVPEPLALYKNLRSPPLATFPCHYPSSNLSHRPTATATVQVNQSSKKDH